MIFAINDLTLILTIVRSKAGSIYHLHQHVLLQDRWFANLPVAVRQNLVDHMKVVEASAGQPLFLRGGEFDGVYCVLKGAVRISACAVDGSEGILTSIQPPQWFGELGLFDRRSRTHDATAEGDAFLLHLSVAALDDLLAKDPVLAQHFGALLSQKMRDLFRGLEGVSLLPRQAWVARRLVMLASQQSRADPGKGKQTVSVPQDELALMLAMARQTVNRILHKLEDDGILRCGYAQIDILDWDALVREAWLSRP